MINKLKELGSKKKLAFIIGSKIEYKKDIWKEIIDTFFCTLQEINGELKEHIDKLRNKDILPEIFFRLLYQEIGENIWDLLDIFKTSYSIKIYDLISYALKKNKIDIIGITSISNSLKYSLKKFDLKENKDYSLDPTAENLPIIYFFNGNIEDKNSIQKTLDKEDDKFREIREETYIFFNLCKKKQIEGVVIIGLNNKELCYRNIYGKLLQLAKKENLNIYWLEEGDISPTIAIKHITEIGESKYLNYIDYIETLKEILDIKEELNLSIENIENNGERIIENIKEWLKKEERGEDIFWFYFIANLLYIFQHKESAIKIFNMLGNIYLKEEIYDMTASCYRNIGKILFEKGFLKKSIEYHIKALEYWEKIKDFYNMGEEHILCGDDYWNGSVIDKAVQHYGDALSLFRKINNIKGIAKVTSKLGMICEIDEDFSLAKRYFVESLRAKKNIKNELESVITIINLVNCLLKEEKYEEAREYLEEGLNISFKYGDIYLLVEIYNLLAIISLNFQNLEEAKEYYNKIYKIYKTQKENIFLSFLYCSLGHINTITKNYEEAIKNYENAIENYEKMGDWPQVAFIYNNLGLIYSAMGNYDSAEDNFAQAEQIFALLGDAHNLIRVHNNLASIYIIKKDIENAIECYKANIEMLKHLGIKKELAETLVSLGIIYFQNKKYETSLNYLEDAVEIYNEIGYIHEKEDTQKIINIIKTNFLKK